MKPRCSSAFYLDDAVLGLLQTDPLQPGGWERTLHASPDCQGYIFGGGQTTLEPTHVAGEMAMSDVVDDEVLHNPVDLLQIDHHAQCHFNRSAHSHLRRVVR